MAWPLASGISLDCGSVDISPTHQLALLKTDSCRALWPQCVYYAMQFGTFVSPYQLPLAPGLPPGDRSINSLASLPCVFGRESSPHSSATSGGGRVSRACESRHAKNSLLSQTPLTRWPPLGPRRLAPGPGLGIKPGQLLCAAGHVGRRDRVVALESNKCCIYQMGGPPGSGFLFRSSETRLCSSACTNR